MTVFRFLGDLGDEDQGFEGFDLAEEQPAGTVRSGPVFEQGPGDSGDVRPAAVPPQLDRGPDAVDVIRLGLLLLGEQVVEQPLLLLLRGRDRDEVTALPAAVANLAGDVIGVVEQGGRDVED